MDTRIAASAAYLIIIVALGCWLMVIVPRVQDERCKWPDIIMFGACTLLFKGHVDSSFGAVMVGWYCIGLIVMGIATADYSDCGYPG